MLPRCIFNSLSPRQNQKRRESAKCRRVRQFTRQVAASAIALTAFTSAAIAAPPADANRTQTKQTSTLTFEQAMDIGYRASKQGDLNTALINFRRALAIRPGHPYAAAAADNMAYYIQYERMATRRRAISQLESRLARAQAQKQNTNHIARAALRSKRCCCRQRRRLQLQHQR